MNLENEIEEAPPNLMDGLLSEILRVKEIQVEYKAIGPPGMFASALMEISLKKAQEAIAENDVIQMLSAYKDLKEYEW